MNVIIILLDQIFDWIGLDLGEIWVVNYLIWFDLKLFGSSNDLIWFDLKIIELLNDLIWYDLKYFQINFKSFSIIFQIIFTTF